MVFTHDVVVLTFNIDYKAYTSSDLNHLKVKTLVTLRYANAKLRLQSQCLAIESNECSLHI